MPSPHSYPSRVETENGDGASLTYDSIDADAVIRSVGDDSAGATACFIGTTRNSFQGKRVTRLDYEAYTELAMKTLQSILTQARTLASPPSIIRSAVHHRLGTVPVGDVSIVVAVSSPHRREAFETCEWILEEVKKKAEIWKQEWYEGDLEEEAKWKANFS